MDEIDRVIRELRERGDDLGADAVLLMKDRNEAMFKALKAREETPK